MADSDLPFHLQIGKEAEQMASDFLRNEGYIILSTNYRYKRAEIDIICTKNNTLIFLEVKYRSNVAFGFPESYVTSKKIQLIKSAADQYIYESNWLKDIRFDIISIEKQKRGYKILHIKDAFH